MCRFDRISIAPFGLGAWAWHDALEESLTDQFGVPVFWREEMGLVPEAYDASRRQYAGEPFLRRLLELPHEPTEILLGVTPVDLYAPGLNFIFGLASPAGVCVISLKRLDNRFYGLAADHEHYFRRVLTEAVHEIGHVLGLPHCPDPHCVMHFSNSLADTDEKGYHFCPNCRKVVDAALCRR